MSFLRGVIAAIAAIVIIGFAIANRESVTVGFDPLPFAVGVPLYAVVLVALALGIVIGGTVTWLRGHRWRRLARELGDRVTRLERERRRLEEKAGDGHPSLPVE